MTLVCFFLCVCVCTSYSPFVKWSQKHPLFPRKATVISYEVDTSLLAYKTSFQIAILLAMPLLLKCKFACFDHPSEELTVQMCSYSKILYTSVDSSGVGKSHTPICSLLHKVKSGPVPFKGKQLFVSQLSLCAPTVTVLCLQVIEKFLKVICFLTVWVRQGWVNQGEWGLLIWILSN